MNTHENSDDNEISKLINLLILRVELLSNDNDDDKNIIIRKKKKTISPKIKQIDQNLIEYLYFLFNKFTKDDSETHSTMLDKTNFVHVCQQLVRNGCFHSSSTTTTTTSHSPDRSSSETTITNTNQSSLTVHEYHSNGEEKSVCNEQDTWLIVDLESIQPQYSATLPDHSKVCVLYIHIHLFFILTIQYWSKLTVQDLFVNADIWIDLV